MKLVNRNDSSNPNNTDRMKLIDKDEDTNMLLVNKDQCGNDEKSTPKEQANAKKTNSQ
jgi:hypothetical protein